MTSHYATVNGKYPWIISPLAFGIITGYWKFLVFLIWLFCGVEGRNLDEETTVLSAFIPELVLGLYEIRISKKLGSLESALRNVMHSAGMIEESNYITMFGYRYIRRAPIFYLDKIEGGYLLTFKPQGCPNSTRDLLPFLQRELLGYEVIPTGELGTQYIIRRRRMRGLSIDDSFFCH